MPSVSCFETDVLHTNYDANVHCMTVDMRVYTMYVFYGSLVLRFSGSRSLGLWFSFYCTLVLWFPGSLVLWFYSCLDLCY